MNSRVTGDRTEGNIKRGFLVSGYLFLAIAIISFVVIFFNQKSKIENTHGWEKTKCTVLARSVSTKSRKSRRDFFWFIKYQYEFDGEEYTSTKYSLLGRGLYIGRTSKLDATFDKKIKKMVDENSGPYAEDSKQNCYVNPHNPKESLLVLIQPTILNTLIFLCRQARQVFVCTVMLIVGVILRRCGVNKTPVWSD